MRDHDQVDPYLDVFPDDAIDVYDFLFEVGRVDVEPVGIKQLDQAKENIGIFRRGAAPDYGLPSLERAKKPLYLFDAQALKKKNKSAGRIFSDYLKSAGSTPKTPLWIST